MDIRTQSQDLFALLMTGNVPAAAQQVLEIYYQYGRDRTCKLVLGVAYHGDLKWDDAFVVYALIPELLDKAGQENTVWHEIARNILMGPLSSHPGAMQASVYHARRVCDLEPDRAASWAGLIAAASGPKLLISHKEMRTIAKHLHAIDPHNKMALRWLEILPDQEA